MKKQQKIKEITNKVINNRALRTALTRKSHFWFFLIYFPHYIKYPTAAFQREMFAITEDKNIKNAVIVAFRGSAKSTIFTLSYPIWAILGKQQKKFVVIVSQTQALARQHLKNLKDELEKNKLLRSDLGPFKEEEDEWRSYSLVIPKYEARITAFSTEQNIRGLRHGPTRPDLIICDDIEDLNSIETRENRDKTYRWLTGDIIPAGDKNTRMILVGNLLHEDSVLMRLIEGINENKFDGVYRKYPLLDENNSIAWPGKYWTLEDIENLKHNIGNDISWKREYLLEIVSEEDAVVDPSWIKYYDILPSTRNKDYKYTWSAVDLAISEKSSAHYTAMVSAQIHGCEENLRIYILPNCINERLDFPKTVERVKTLSKILGNGYPTKVFVEDVAYQSALPQYLRNQGYPIEGVKPQGDKRARLSLTTHLIQGGKILFPKKGSEKLIEQLVGFKKEKYDDLVDAFAMLILEIMKNDLPTPTITWI